MDTLSSTAVARELGISLPTLHRAVRALGKVHLDDRGRLRVDAGQAEKLRRRFGVIPRVRGLTRTETQTLVALSRHPRGLVSVRQVAAAARLSPTAAGRALTTLGSEGLIGRRRTRLFDGEVVDRDVFVVDWRSPAWRAVAPTISRAVLPEPPPRRCEHRRLPPRLAATFWTGDWRALDVRAHPKAVAHRILNEGRSDPEAISWLGELPESAVRQAVEEGLASKGAPSAA